MWVYIQSEFAGHNGCTHNLYTVGFYSPDGKWHGDSDWNDKEEAAKRVHWLNGGEVE